MIHYYAYCETHGKCGLNRENPNQAAKDCNDHVSKVPGPHGLVYPKLSNITTENGVKKYTYKKLTDMSISK